MSDTSARLLRLLALMQATPDWTGPELARRLNVSTRTVRNDVARLRDLGYPVEATPGVAGGYRLAAGAHVPPLLLEDDEAVAVAVGLRTVACMGVAGIEETALRALAKLEQLVPARLRRRVGALGAFVAPLRWGADGPAVDPETLALLTQACRDREQVRFDYLDRQGTSTRRLVEPYRLVPDGHRWYLVAWDVRRDDWRTFRVDRSQPPRLAGVRFTERPIPGGDAAAFVRDSAARQVPRHQAVIRLHATLEEMKSRIPPGAGELAGIDPTTCRFTARTDSLEWLAVRLAMLGCDFTVESPPELVDILRALGTRVGRATAGAHPRLTP